jgi:hypothetical protein
MPVSVPPEVTRTRLAISKVAVPFVPTLTLPAEPLDSLTLVTWQNEFFVETRLALAAATVSMTLVLLSGPRPVTVHVFVLSLPAETRTTGCGGNNKAMPPTTLEPFSVTVVVLAPFPVVVAMLVALYPVESVPSMTSAVAPGTTCDADMMDVLAATRGPTVVTIARMSLTLAS